MACVLITGGSGFIGSHVALVLLEAGHRVIVIDDFTTGSPLTLQRVSRLAGAAASERLVVIQGDVRVRSDLERAFAAAPPAEPVEAVVHLAGLKVVAESLREPLRYWDVNVGGTRQLLAVMRVFDCRALVFSSSASVYGRTDHQPIGEATPMRPLHPYGRTKWAVELMLSRLSVLEPGWRVLCLRYFNAVGAHPSGLIGESGLGDPTHLFPLIAEVATGVRPWLEVFGADWSTPDGTGVRDYIHVLDLAEAHQAALAHVLASSSSCLSLNLGAGHGHSVLEVVAAYEAASGRSVPCRLRERRPGDVASAVAEVSLAARTLGWRSRRSIDEICRDAWRFHQASGVMETL